VAEYLTFDSNTLPHKGQRIGGDVDMISTSQDSGGLSTILTARGGEGKK